MANGVRKSVYLDSWMVKRLDALSEKMGISFNGLVRASLALTLSDPGGLE